MLEYYARRASEYETIYAKPERQEDLALLRSRLTRFFAGARVLEVACGTGYWTSAIAEGAESVIAVDLSPDVLEVARAKRLPRNVELRVGDAFSLDASGSGFTAAVAAFWWSHIPKARLGAFLDHLHGRLVPGSPVVFIDNRCVPGSSTAVSRTDAEGNTYQERRLRDGSKYEVLKNFPVAAELYRHVAGRAVAPQVDELQFYWWLSYRTPAEVE